jgi:hypothetical protein
VEGAAHRPELHERALFPEGLVNRAALQSFDSRPEAQLGRGDDLGVQAADLSNDADEIGQRGPPNEAMSLHPPRQRLLPRQPMRQFARHGRSVPPRRNCRPYLGPFTRRRAKERVFR